MESKEINNSSRSNSLIKRKNCHIGIASELSERAIKAWKEKKSEEIKI
jgi:hypothetical protein